METPMHTSCRICHRALKDIASQLKGIGPVCAKHQAVADKRAERNLYRYFFKTVNLEIAIQFYQQITRNCLCGLDLRDYPIQYEDVERTDGWEVPGVGKRWLFIHCPKCDTDRSLNHLGV